MNEIIKERLEFLKLEYQQLRSWIQHLENTELRMRQFSLTLWLISLGVGLGLLQKV